MRLTCGITVKIEAPEKCARYNSVFVVDLVPYLALGTKTFQKKSEGYLLQISDVDGGQ